MGKGFGAAYELGDGVNASGNADLTQLAASRRLVLKGTASAVALMIGSTYAYSQAFAQARSSKAMGFTGVGISSADNVTVPPEYEAQVLLRWGDSIGLAATPAFKPDASNTAADQLLQAGMHHDAVEFFPINQSTAHGLLAINHEYTDDGLLHSDGMKTWTSEKVYKSMHAHGVSVVEVKQGVDKNWRVVADSRYARRIHALTPMQVSGPAAGHALLKTAADPSGQQVLGTLNNCAAGKTPWGTYLTCEENWNSYFNSVEQPSKDEQRYGLRKNGFGYRWHEHEERFDTAKHPNEAHRFGWVVEIDPFDPNQTPIKRSALGRIKHEGATTTLTRDGRAVVYMGDDERFEYIYKFVSRDKMRPGGYKNNRELLDHGTLYVARFDARGVGAWLPLLHGQNGLTPANGFADQAEVLIKCRQAADQVGATKMDRPEWIAVHPQSKEVFVTLTNNNQRGQPGRSVDDANPREDNVMGHIIRWREGNGEGSDIDALQFRWLHFALAGDAKADKPEHRGDIKGDMYGSPDGLVIDTSGLMWIMTDVSTSVLGKGAYKDMGNNMMLCADPTTGQTKRFLTGPAGCEITGLSFTPDRRALFVNIQHPGETASERSDPDKPQAISTWPDGPAGGRPRSATLMIRRKDGGVVGT
jgi:uncharacterized protein